MPAHGFAAVGSGAAAGAWLRWVLGIYLNPVFPTVPLGTVSANLLGGLIIGAVMTAAEPLHFPPALRLLLHEQLSLVYARLPAQFGVIGQQAHPGRSEP